MFSLYQTQSPEETIELGKRLAQRLAGGDTVLFFGELGSGKTHFIKGLAQGLGILMTIKSPTYAYVNKYPIPYRNPKSESLPTGQADSKSETKRSNHKSQITSHKGKVFYHYDLYRMSEGDDFASIGLDESLADPEAINAIEWADRLEGRIPKRCILVHLSDAGNHHEIRIEFLSPTILEESAIEPYYEEWATPKNVRRHCRTVAHVAMAIAEAYVRRGEIVNSNLLYVGAMLHDMARVCDFRTLGRSKFEEKVTDKLWEKWNRLREAHAGQQHAFIAYEQLESRGYTETAELIRLHEAELLGLEPLSFTTLESKILYYADKRVKHDMVVDLAERFRDGRERYGEGDTPEMKNLFLGIEQYSLELEKELFRGLDIRPEDIRPIIL
jgi:tRNA threonylcarbamoyladenosine biosynthesis protein TsaE